MVPFGSALVLSARPFWLHSFPIAVSLLFSVKPFLLVLFLPTVSSSIVSTEESRLVVLLERYNEAVLDESPGFAWHAGS